MEITSWQPLSLCALSPGVVWCEVCLVWCGVIGVSECDDKVKINFKDFYAVKL